MNKSFFCLIFFFTGILAHAQPKAPVAATVDRSKIFIGEQFDLILDVRSATETPPAFFKLDSLAHFEIVAKSKIDTTSVGKETLLSQRITLTSWDSGRWQLPSFSLGGMGKTKPIAIEVTYSPMDPKQDYHDVKEILDVQKPKQPNWHWYLVGLALLIGLFLLLFPRKKKKKPEVVSNPDAYKIAMAGLQKLKKEGAAKDAKSFYVDLIDVFRKYLQDRKGLQSLSKTTDDLALQIKNLNLPSGLYQPLVHTLQLSDAVKFARFVPAEGENKQSLDVIQKNIDAIEKI